MVIEYDNEYYIEEEEEQHSAILAILLLFIAEKEAIRLAMSEDVHAWYSKYGTQGVVTYMQSRKLIPKTTLTRRASLLGQLNAKVDALGRAERNFFVEVMQTLYPDLERDTILNTKWAADGLTFNDRVRRDVVELKHFMEKELTSNLIRKDTADVLDDALAKKLKTIENRVVTRYQTEMVALVNLHKQSEWKAAGIERYKFKAIMDERTSEICREMNNKTFLLEELEVGINAPPLHPRCRSHIVPLRG